MLHHKAPHRPWQPDPAQAARFKDRWIPEPETFWDAYDTRTDALRENHQRVGANLTSRDLKLPPPEGLTGPPLTAWLGTKPDSVTTTVEGKTVTLMGEALTRWKYQRFMRDYLATVQSVDEGVGRVLDFLDRNGLAKNTIVIYTSDQGFFLGDHGLYDKRFMYEESLRMPFLVRWPAAIKPRARSDAIALNIDFAPTFSPRRVFPRPPACRAEACCPCFAANTTGLAHRRCIPLLPRPGRSQHARALRRSHAHAQADSFLEEGSVGALRPGERSVRAPQPVRPAGTGRVTATLKPSSRGEAGGAGRAPARGRADPERRRRARGEAAGKVGFSGSRRAIEYRPAGRSCRCAS